MVGGALCQPLRPGRWNTTGSSKLFRVSLDEMLVRLAVSHDELPSWLSFSE
jgi:hypothetical protein